SWSTISTGSAISKPITRPIAMRVGSPRPPPCAVWRAPLEIQACRDRTGPGYVRYSEYVRTRRRRAGAARPVSAGVAELADALDLGSSDENRGGSNPPARTSGPPGIQPGIAAPRRDELRG